SSKALQYWLRVGPNAVWSWRKAFGIGTWGTEGSRLLLGRTLKASAKIRKATGLGLPDRWAETGGTAEQLALLGTAPDEDLARRLGGSVKAVRVRRTRRGIPTARDRRRST